MFVAFFLPSTTMPRYKPVTIPRAAFAFCRYGLALLLWIGIVLQNIRFIEAAVIIFGLSYLLKVGRAPMVVIYSQTMNRLWRSPDEVVNEHAIRFAHLVGTVLGLIGVLTYYLNHLMGWIFIGLFAALKSLSALGFCPAAKLYDCATGGSCRLIPKRRGR